MHWRKLTGMNGMWRSVLDESSGYEESDDEYW